MSLVRASLVYLLIAYLLFLPYALINNFLPNFLVLSTISYYNRIKGVEEREIPMVRLHGIPRLSHIPRCVRPGDLGGQGIGPARRILGTPFSFVKDQSPTQGWDVTINVAKGNFMTSLPLPGCFIFVSITVSKVDQFTTQVIYGSPYLYHRFSAQQ
jgi:hypothetical protein